MSETREAQKQSDLSFSDALVLLKEGVFMTRALWVKLDIIPFVMMVKMPFTDHDGSQSAQFVLAFDMDLNIVGGMGNWTPNNEDLFANDWLVRDLDKPFPNTLINKQEVEDISDVFPYSYDPARGFPIIPVYCEESSQFFVDNNIVAPKLVELIGEKILTSPLRFGKKLDLLGISLVNKFLNEGIQDCTDCINDSVILANIYILVNGKLNKINVLNSATASCVPAVQGNYRDLSLCYTNHVTVGNNVSLDIEIKGTVNLQFGTIEIYATMHEVKTLNDEVVNLTLLGYDVQAHRANPNRRPR
jgi:hypothetical protein